MMASPTLSPVLVMLDGKQIPQVGLGVYKVSEEDAATAIAHAIEVGYRHVDTASLYENEAAVGAAIQEAPVDRSELFVTTKLGSADHGYDRTLRAFVDSMGKLGLEYVDLYLIHWPVPSQDLYVETWRALQAIKATGRARSIGVSNFTGTHIDRLIADGGELPVLNQIELHPWLAQAEQRAYDASRGILTEAWSPLARGRLLDAGGGVLERIADKHGRSSAQIVIRWHVQLGNVVIPKSVTPSRIEENFRVFDFTLDDEDLGAIATLERGRRTGRDPDTD
ncbi:MAG: oxidoreductase [Thermoleophilia bacterium]|nr:oxidoreductase [Thermoleophilia bacterium]